MRRWLPVMFLIGVAFLAGVPMTAAQDKPVIMKWGIVVPPEHPFVFGMNKTAEIVAQKTNNRIQIQVFHSAQLGTGKDMIESTVFGSQAMVTDGAGVFGQWAPRLNIMAAPYLFADATQMYKAMRSPIVQEMLDELVTKRGLRSLGAANYGTRHLTANKAVTKPEDVRGMKIRVPEVPLFVEMVRAWGGNPTPIAFSELYMALKQGTVDAQENPIPTIFSGKYYEVQKYLILTGHIIVPMFHVISEKLWKSFSAGDQKILQDAMDEGIALSDDMLMKQELSQVDEFKKKGMQVITPDVAAFKKASMAALPKLEGMWGKGLYEKLSDIR